MTKNPAEARGPKVLVIDDEPRLCKFLQDSLSLMGCEVSTAHTGEGGVELLKTQAFDVVLCDIMMPGAGGIWALETIKETWASTQVIMMTGYATRESAEVCKSLGAYSFMTKPFELDDVRAEIEKAFQKKLARVLREDVAEAVVVASEPAVLQPVTA